jgi:putative ABC transport system ATP-binding protein
MIKFENVTKTYVMGKSPFQALKGVSFTIKQGELFAIIGPSGSGKTTTMNMMGLMDKPTTGKYYLDELDTSKFTGDKLADLRNERLGFIFQQFNLLGKLTALENVMLPLTYRRSEKLSLNDMRNRAMKILAEVEMDKFSSHRPLELSGGQQQRVAIARALVGKPSIILADEPTGALDTKTTEQIMTLLIKQMSATGTTVVIITHNPDIAARCHRSIAIRDGLVYENTGVVPT